MSEFDGLREAASKATPGRWKLWGMSVMADQDGTSNVDTAVYVASTHYLDENGKPRTWDAKWVVLSQPAEVLALLDRLEAAEAAVARVRALADAWGDDKWSGRDAAAPFVRAIRAALAGEGEADSPPRTHKTAPVSDRGPESGQGRPPRRRGRALGRGMGVGCEGQADPGGDSVPRVWKASRAVVYRATVEDVA